MPNGRVNINRCKKGYSHKAYCPGEKFTIGLTAHDLDCYKKIAKLGFLLGGVGNRSRRGFGSIRNINWNFADVCNLRQEVLKTLNDVAGFKWFQINSESIESTLTDFPDYPVIRGIFFGQPTKYVDNLLKKIGQATHDAKRLNRDDTLGGGVPRMASPVVVRIQMVDSQYIPVVTQLYSPYPNNRSPHRFRQKQEQFIDAIIGDSHE